MQYQIRRHVLHCHASNKIAAVGSTIAHLEASALRRRQRHPRNKRRDARPVDDVQRVAAQRRQGGDSGIRGRQVRQLLRAATEAAVNMLTGRQENGDVACAHLRTMRCRLADPRELHRGTLFIMYNQRP